MSPHFAWESNENNEGNVKRKINAIGETCHATKQPDVCLWIAALFHHLLPDFT